MYFDSVQSAKDVANATANLVKEIKALDQDYSPLHRERCSAATQPLLGNIYTVGGHKYSYT